MPVGAKAAARGRPARAAGPALAADRCGLAAGGTRPAAGAEAHGFDTDLWTLPRIAEVIWRLTGVGYHPGHVWWRRSRHHGSPQRPARRGSERDKAEIARWRAEKWPRIKGGR